MGLIVIDLDIKNLPLEDFMKALGYEPTRREGNRLTYNAPYSADGNATMVVDTEKNGWYDSNEPEKYYGGIYDLAYELTGSCNRSELNIYIAAQMKGFVDFKIYGMTANGEEVVSGAVLGTYGSAVTVTATKETQPMSLPPVVPNGHFAFSLWI